MFLVYIGIWLVCGLVAAGFICAYAQEEFKSNRRDDVAKSLMLGLIGGPIALILSLFMTGFWRHGWRL